MVKTPRWFKSLIRLNQPHSHTSSNNSNSNRRVWSCFARSSSINDDHHKDSKSTTPTPIPIPAPVFETDDCNKRAIAVAAATAARAAALAVRLTSRNGRSDAVQAAAAAVIVQSHFRGYLARRALRALKGLVRLQALIRGHIMRKRTAETMGSMQALFCAQARARTVKASIQESSHSSSKSSHTIHSLDPTMPDKFEQILRSRIPKHEQLPKLGRNDSRSRTRVVINQDQGCPSSRWSDPRMNTRMQDVQAPSISVGDTSTNGRYFSSAHRNPYECSRPNSVHATRSCSTSRDSTAQSFEVVQSLNAVKLSAQDVAFCSAESRPRFFSASSRGGSSRHRPFTPTKSDGSASCLSAYSDCPSYMAYTESARAKVRSVSAPRQRKSKYGRTSFANRYSVHELADTASSANRVSAMRASFASKVGTGSSHGNRLGVPVRGNPVGHNSRYSN